MDAQGFTNAVTRFGAVQQFELSDAERAALIAVLRRIVDADPDPTSIQMRLLRAILERLHAATPKSIPEDASTG